MSVVGRQYRLARNCTRAVLSAPQVLLYPVLATVLSFGYPILLFGYPMVGGYNSTVMTAGFLLYLVIVPLIISFSMVAYCYELNELFEGRQPSPGDGARVAANRLRLVGVAALVFGTGGAALQYLGLFGRIGSRLGSSAQLGLEVVHMFAFPVVALSPADGTVRDAFEDVVDAMQSEFGAATVSAVGIRLLNGLIVSSGFLAAIGLLVAWFYRGVDIAVGPLGPFTLPILFVFGSAITASVVGLAVSGVVKTALYRYASDGELPAELGVGIDDLVDTAPSDGIRPPESGAFAWLSLGRQQAGRAIKSLPLWGLAITTALVSGIAAFFISTLYTRVLEGALGTVRESDANVEQVANAEEFEALELVLGADPTRYDVQTMLESLLGSGDLLGVVVLSTLILTLGPVLGLVVTVPAIIKRRRDGYYSELLDAGYGPRDVVLGTFLGRLTAASVVVVLPSLVIAAAVWNRQAAVGVPYVVATLFAIACIGIFVAFGVLVGTAARGWKSAIGGSLGVLLIPYVFSGNPAGVTSVPDRDSALEAVLAPPWDFLPAVLTRFNLHNVITDGMHFFALSSVVESFPRISRTALNPILSHEAPPQEAVAELPFYLQQWFVYPVVAIWIAIPLVAAIVAFDPEL
ncbi:ABC transporter permease subunit [Halopiger djelfimassiliensis]|uniref:ABC transporter permease subunit n=1 Tax=Halopiger djelfimassiliensis TaxID=1293047 RepID=UPI000677BCE0|nr:ABC transporter permease subunit [Halopiger djelfimassiliensis]